MAILDNQGCFFSYIHGELDINSDEISVSKIDNLNYSNVVFFKELESIKKNLQVDNTNLDIFSIVCREEISKEIESTINNCLKSNIEMNFDELTIQSFVSYIKYYFKAINKTSKINVFIERTKYLTYFFLYVLRDDIDKSFFRATIDIWTNNEGILLYGKKVLNQSFLLKELNGRHIISSLFDTNYGQRYLLIEGGLKVYLDKDMPYSREEIGIRDINLFTNNDLQNILMNPIYGLGRYFEPTELFLSWEKVFFYVLAISDSKFNINNIEKIYNKFLDFISTEVCVEIPAQTIISKSLFYEVLLNLINRIRDYLKGKNESILSKDYLLFLQSYYIFIEPLKKLVNEIYINNSSKEDFNLDKYHKLLNQVNGDTNDKKGKSLENVVEYLFKNTQEFKVMAKRIRTDREEIDLSCINISNNSLLWELGAFILVECKNWKEKVDVKVIRELGYITFYKGNKTSVLVTRTGITKKGKDEIHRLAVLGKYILVINVKDLSTILSTDMFIKLLIDRYKQLEDEIKNDFCLLGE